MKKSLKNQRTIKPNRIPKQGNMSACVLVSSEKKSLKRSQKSERRNSPQPAMSLINKSSKNPRLSLLIKRSIWTTFDLDSAKIRFPRILLTIKRRSKYSFQKSRQFWTLKYSEKMRSFGGNSSTNKKSVKTLKRNSYKRLFKGTRESYKPRFSRVISREALLF